MLSIKKFKNESEETSYDFSILFDSTNKSANLFGLISLSSKQASDLSRAIGIVSDFVVTKFEENTISILSRLGSIQRDTLALIMSVPIDPDDEIDFFLGLLSVENDTFYVYFEQESFNIFIRRNEKNIWINKNSSDVMFTGSGKLIEGDTIYLLTKNMNIEDFDINQVKENGAGIVVKYSSQITQSPEVMPFIPEVPVTSTEEIPEPSKEQIKSAPLQKNPTFDKKKRFPDSTYYAKLIKLKGVFLIYGFKYLKIALEVTKDTAQSILDFILVRFNLKKPTLMKSGSKNLRVKIGFASIVIFAILIIFLIVKSAGDNAKEQNNKKAYESLMSQIDGEVTTLSKASSPLNFVALSQVNQIQGDLEKASSYAKYKNDQKINEYKLSVLSSQDKINEIIPLSDTDIITVLSAKFPDVKTQSMTILSNGTIIVLASNQNNLYVVDAANPINITQVSISELQSAKFITSLNNRVFVYDTTKGLYEIDVTAKKSTLLPGFLNIGNVTDMQTFDGKIYLLSDSSNKIYRSFQVGNSFSIPSEYNPTTPLPAGASGFAIDGKVFIVTNNGILERFYVGKLDSDTNISITGVQKAFMGNVKIQTNAYAQNSSTNELYILDPGNNRILKINKDSSSLVSQYVYRGSKGLFKDLKQLVLSSDQKTLYALDSDYIFKLSLSE